VSDLIERLARTAYPDVWAEIDAAPDTREAVDASLLTRVRALEFLEGHPANTSLAVVAGNLLDQRGSICLEGRP